MPVYHYDCEACGPFTAMRPMAEFGDPCACPACGFGAPRALSAPAIAGLAPMRRNALASNKNDASRQGPAPALHPAGCGCCLRRSPIPTAVTNSRRVFWSNGPLRHSLR